MINIDCIINILCSSAYIALMFFGPFAGVFFIIKGAAAYSKVYWWLIAALIGFLMVYAPKFIHVSQSVKMWGNGAFAIAFILINALFLSVFLRRR